jgi:hypothetical protein
MLARLCLLALLAGLIAASLTNEKVSRTIDLT